MPLRRSSVLFAVLVVLPLALLAWLGSYLMRDAAKRTEASMQAILAERLSSADYQLVHDLRQLTDQFDVMAANPVAAQELARHSWVARVWVEESDGRVTESAGVKQIDAEIKVVPSERMTAIRAAMRKHGAVHDGRVQSDDGGPPFERVAEAQQGSKDAAWSTYFKLTGYHIHDGAAAKNSQASGWHVSDSTFIYWLITAEGRGVCALMDAPLLMNGLFARLPHPGLAVPPGRMMLATESGVPLHQWGKRLVGSEGPPASHRTCSEPLPQWVLAYTPANEEFPQPYLFPIVLGIGSGILLVLVVGWLYFHESTRELQVAHQRVTFVNQISHELKTPLTNIRLYAEMAAARATSQGDAIMQRQLGVVEAETSRLDRLISNVLNYARQQRDKLTIALKPVVLDEIVTRAVEFWKPQLENKGFKIEVSLHGPATLQADADALTQILGNLLSNVEKYAVAGHYVGIRTEVLEGMAQLTVEDRGPGIPSGKRRTVFEPFERLRSDLTEGVSGTGIGLTISRELAQLHGGSLTVCPQYRDGSRFILSLPIRS